jgi:hypothetical protein
MAYDDKMVSSDGMNQHKKMAGAGDKGSFGVSTFPGRAGVHPDIAAKTGSKGMMAEGERGIPMSSKVNGKQPSPDHAEGKGAPDHFSRDSTV